MNAQSLEQADSVVPRNPFLDDFFSESSPMGVSFKCFKNVNCGRPTFTTTLNMFQIFQHTDVSNDRLPEEEQSQRPLDQAHAKGLALYILKSLLEAAITKKKKHGELVSDKFNEILNELGPQPYYSIAPLVANIRTVEVKDVLPMQDRAGKTISYEVTLRHGDVLWIIDGQHRRKGIEMVYDFLNNVTSYLKYPKSSFYPSKTKDVSLEEMAVWNACKEVSKWCEITLECHIGLTIEQERQLFHDLNNKGKKVDKGLAYKFDNSNPVNLYVTKHLISRIFDDRGFKIDDKDDVDWEEVTPGISRKQLIAVNAILFLNKSNINGALPADVTDYSKDVANQYWMNVLEIHGMLESKHKTKTVAAQPAVLKAIAKLYYDVFFGKNEELRTDENQVKLLDELNSFDFSHSNPAWRYYMMSDEDRVANGLDGLKSYLPKDDDGKIRDLGSYDEASGLFRFARAHNDVVPLIADILRWKFGFPSRNN